METTVVKLYKGSPKLIALRFERDLMKMQAKGYEPINQTLLPGKRGGCLGCMTLGVGSLLMKPDDTLQVTYQLRT